VRQKQSFKLGWKTEAGRGWGRESKDKENKINFKLTGKRSRGWTRYIACCLFLNSLSKTQVMTDKEAGIKEIL